MRVQEAADLLEVSPSTVRRWAAGGRIACRRTPSGQRRFLASDLERVLAGHSPRGQEHPPAAAPAEQRYRLLYETSRDLSSSLKLDEVLQVAAQRLSTLLQVPDCDIYRS